MTWTNAFDVGACEVSVYLDVNLVHSSVMGKGDSATIDMGTYGLAPMELAVSSEGIVSVSSDDHVPGNKGGVAVLVSPGDAYADAGKRASDITVDVGPWGQDSAQGFGLWNNGADLIVDLDGSPPDDWSPDPCLLPSGASVIGIYGEDSAI